MAGVGLEHRRAELDRAGGSSGERHRHQRVAAHRAREPERREAVGLGPLGLLDHPLDARGSPRQPDAHGRTLPVRPTSGASSDQPAIAGWDDPEPAVAVPLELHLGAPFSSSATVPSHSWSTRRVPSGRSSSCNGTWQALGAEVVQRDGGRGRRGATMWASTAGWGWSRTVERSPAELGRLPVALHEQGHEAEQRVGVAALRRRR